MKARPIFFAAAAGCELVLVHLASAHGDFARAGEALVFVPLMLLAGISFLCAVRFAPDPRARTLWAVAIALRVSMLACAPCDDFWRYAWEGRVQNAGKNPYALSPAALELARLRDENWPRINHAEVAAIYPPAAELTFAALTRVSSSPLWFKCVFIAADLLTLALLRRLVNPASAAWYAWNPAVVYAFAGAAHYDSLMLLAMTGAMVALSRAAAPAAEVRRVPRPANQPPHTGRGARWTLTAGAAVLLGLGIALKIVPIVLLPVWAFALRARAWLLAVSLAIPALLTLPYGGPGIVLKSARDFGDITRFNELLVWIFPNPWQRNWPVNTLLCATIAVIVVRFRHDWQRSALWVLGAALVLSPVLHPWYATWILPLAIWRRQPAWTVLSISAIAALLLWETTPLWTAWRPNLLTRALVVLPPLLAWWIGRKHPTLNIQHPTSN